MKLKILFIFIFITIVSCNQDRLDIVADFKSNKITEYINYSESDSIHENWAEDGELFLSELKEVLKNDERNVNDILKIDEKDKRTKLGFGYEQIESSMGKGYAGVYFNLILKEGQVISYEFIPKFPRNKDLKERFTKLFSEVFKIDNNTIHNRYYNIKEMEKPLKNIKSDISLNENLRFLMTPFSGTRYGYSGGYSGGLFNNRSIFLEEYKNITPKVCQILMYSKNPGTRLMAIEYFMENKSNFKNPDLINNWIDKVFTELPTIETLEGCFVMQRDSKKLVLEYVKRKN